MTWGGGMGGGLGGAPGAFGRPAAPGLPFAGIPSELQGGVDRLLRSEPEHAEPDVVFSQTGSEEELKRLTLWRLLTKYRGMLTLAALLIAVIAVTAQAGPKLTEIAINDGMTPGHTDFAVVAAMAGAYFVFIVVTSFAQRFQVKVSGRLAAWVMNDLRVQVFAHLQRLSLAFFTDEKAGVVMSRMTSDIENLQQLLQDGLSQLAIQALTMVVITVDPVHHQRAAGGDHRAAHRPCPRRRLGLVQRGVRAGLRAGARRDRQRAGRPLREPARRAHRDRPQPPAPQRASTTATWSATTATPTSTPPT